MTLAALSVVRAYLLDSGGGSFSHCRVVYLLDSGGEELFSLQSCVSAGHEWTEAEVSLALFKPKQQMLKKN